MNKILLLFAATTFFIGCSSSQKSSPKLDFGTLRLVSATVNDTTIFDFPESASAPEIEFMADSTVSGNTLCNSFGGSYSISNQNQINISIDFMTMAMCPDNNIEQIFLEQLKLAEYFTVNRDTLLLSIDKRKPTLIFIKK